MMAINMKKSRCQFLVMSCQWTIQSLYQSTANLINKKKSRLNSSMNSLICLKSPALQSANAVEVTDTVLSPFCPTRIISSTTAASTSPRICRSSARAWERGKCLPSILETRIQSLFNNSIGGSTTSAFTEFRRSYQSKSACHPSLSWNSRKISYR